MINVFYKWLRIENAIKFQIYLLLWIQFLNSHKQIEFKGGLYDRFNI